MLCLAPLQLFARSLKEAVADPWLTLITKQHGMVCADNTVWCVLTTRYGVC